MLTSYPKSHKRMKEWRAFSHQVCLHINEYTLPQYGNPDGDEQIDSFTPEDCFRNIMRYINRRGTNIRGNKETLRDLIKIAHYSCVIYYKLLVELGEEDVYVSNSPETGTRMGVSGTEDCEGAPFRLDDFPVRRDG